jgi:MFS family permease
MTAVCRIPAAVPEHRGAPMVHRTDGYRLGVGETQGLPGPGRLRLLIGAVLVNVCLGSLFAWSLFVDPLGRAFAVSPAALSGVFSLAVATFAVVVLVSGRLVDRAPPRRTIIVAAASALAGMLTAASATSLPTVAVGYGLLFGVGNGLGYSTAVAAAGKAFTRRRGSAVGVAVAAYAGGPLVASPAISALLTAYGWRVTFVVLGLAIGALLVLGGVLLGAQPRRAGAGTSAPRDGTHLRLLARPGGLIGGAFLLGTLPALMVVAHAATIAAEAGMDAATTTAAVALLGAGNLTGRAGGGWISDRIGRLPGLRAAAGALAVTCAVLPEIAGSRALLVALVLVGIGYGTQSALVPSLVADIFGPQRFAANFGRVFLGWGVAGLLGPQAGAWLGGTAGGFAAALRVGAASALLALVLYALIARSDPRARTDTSRASRA